MATIPPPKSLEEVVSLIHRLYQPGPPEELSTLQDVLQQVQRSPYGWQLADSLLECKEQHVQFFGALTFTVKLNSDWKSISEDDATVLCRRLVDWLVKLVDQESAPMVIKKLCSTLVGFFIRFTEFWPHCIRHLVCCFATGRVRPAEEFAGAPLSSVLLRTIGPGAKQAVLWFAAILVEEVGKIDVRNIENHQYHLKIQSNAEEAIDLMRNAIEMPNGNGDLIPTEVDVRIVDAGLKTFQAWVYYSLRTYIELRLDIPRLKSLTQLAINWLADDRISETACEVVIDIISQSFAFFTPEDSKCLADVLTSPWAVERFQSLASGDSNWQSIQFSRLLITFAEATVQKLAQSLDTSHGRAMIEMLHGLLTIPGYPQVDDDVSPATFEFWGSLVEYALEVENPEDEPWVVEINKEIKRAVEEYWRKIRIPSNNELVSWSKEEKDGFMTFRKDVADFVDSTYGLLGKPLFGQFVQQVTQALTPGVTIIWEEIEASLFCLHALSDSLGDEPSEDVYLEHLFGSNLFILLADLGVDIPIKARTTSVNLIGSYASFFERRPGFLPPALNFLFTCISTPILARNASKSIASLCSSCRSTLTTELYAFLQQYEIFATSSNADDIAKERVLCAISYVVQAFPSEHQKLEPLSKLLSYVENDVQRCIVFLQRHRVQEAKDGGILAMRCLVAIGKGLQAPDDVPIVLSPDESPPPIAFWGAGAAGLLQQKIVELIRMVCAAFGSDGEIIEACCAVFKTGFTEMTPGLFVFPAEIVTGFLMEYSAQTATILATASTLIGSHSIPGSADIHLQVLRLLGFVAELVVRFGEPQNDPEVALNVVEFLSRLLRRYVGVLVFYQPGDQLEKLFIFSLESLTIKELPLVKKAAAGFWSSFLSLTVPEQETQNAIDKITEGCGPRLAEKLCLAVGGGCARSEVDVMTEPLRKLIVKNLKSKSWLMEALKPDGFPSANLSERDKRVFIEKVIRSRGKLNTNQATREFWLKARGTEFAYAS